MNLQRPWTRTYIRNLANIDNWFPEAMATWDAQVIANNWDFPVRFVVNGFSLSAEDLRCFASLHRPGCMCLIWDSVKVNWEYWIVRPDST